MLSLALAVLIPLTALAALTAGMLAALDAAHEAVSRSSLDKALAGRPAPVRSRLLHQLADARRTLASVMLGRMLSEALMVSSVAGIVFVTWDVLSLGGGWALPLLATLVLSGALVLVILAISPRTIGQRRPESVLLSGRTLLTTVRAVLWLPAGALSRVGDSLDRRPGQQEDPEEGAEKARQNVDRALEDEHVRDGERDMIQGVFDLR
ncbi:MAG TPA: CNNM domain-containing protein, partial [Brachybacterium massiliense]|nr:CNNM domain-containing protein [Brachybacterium massiliense]